MSEIDYRHTARVRADSWFIRFYCWMWEADAENVDFCRLFWGYLLAIPNLLVRAVGYLPWKALKAVGRRLRAISQKIKDEMPTPQEEREWRKERLAMKAMRREKRREKYAGLLGFMSSAGDRVVAFSQAAWPVARWPVYALAIAGSWAVVGAVGYLLYLLGALIVANAADVAVWTAIALGFAVGMALVLLTIAVGAWFFNDTEAGKSVRTGTKDGFLTFGGALLTGAHAIKSRTCPKIEVVDTEEAAR